MIASSVTAEPLGSLLAWCRCITRWLHCRTVPRIHLAPLTLYRAGPQVGNNISRINPWWRRRAVCPHLQPFPLLHINPTQPWRSDNQWEAEMRVMTHIRLMLYDHLIESTSLPWRSETQQGHLWSTDRGIDPFDCCMQCYLERNCGISCLTLSSCLQEIATKMWKAEHSQTEQIEKCSQFQVKG